MKSRGKGWIKDHDDDRKALRSARHLFGAVLRVPSAAMMLLTLAPSPVDQSVTSACVGCAIRCAIDTRLAAIYNMQGPYTDPHSALAIYDYARLEDGGPLQDVGCRPAAAISSLQDHGVPHERLWPFDAAKVNDVPPLDVLEEASVFEISEVFKIDAEGDERIAAIKQALAEGYPVVFGTEVDQAFDDYTGDIVKPAKVGAELGGHMLCLIGYEGDDFWGQNSYGPSWGIGGRFKCRAEFLTDERVSDIYVIMIRPATKAPPAEETTVTMTVDPDVVTGPDVTDVPPIDEGGGS